MAMRRALFIIILIFTLVISSLSISAELADSPWPMFHGGVQHEGLSLYDTSHVDGTIKWTFDTGASIECSPVIGPDGTIYIGNHANDFFAINPDGTEKWRFDVGEPLLFEEYNVWKGILSTPAIDEDGTIYFSSLSDYLFALNPDGTEKWRFSIPVTGDGWSSPAIDKNGTIYIGTTYKSDENAEGGVNDKGKLFAINPDGTEKWRFTVQSTIYSAPAIDKDGIIYFGTYDYRGPNGIVYALNSDGTEKWNFTIEKHIESSPTIGSDGTIYIGSYIGNIYAINPDGTEKWHFETGDGVSSTPAIDKNGTIYIGSWNANFYALNPDGTEKWRFETPPTFEAIISSAAISADGAIYFGSSANYFYALNPDGTEKWNYRSNNGFSSSPAIGSDGTVYVGSYDHNLYAFGESGEGQGDGNMEENGTPGFEAIMVLFALTVILFLKKKKIY